MELPAPQLLHPIK